jgi:hypothetical protein
MTLRRFSFERVVTHVAKAMIAVAVVTGGLFGLALLGIASFGPVLREWANGRSPVAALLLVLVVWPALGVLYIVLEGFFEWVWAGRKSHEGPARPPV